MTVLYAKITIKKGKYYKIENLILYFHNQISLYYFRKMIVFKLFGLKQP